VSSSRGQEQLGQQPHPPSSSVPSQPRLRRGNVISTPPLKKQLGEGTSSAIARVFNAGPRATAAAKRMEVADNGEEDDLQDDEEYEDLDKDKGT
jgi:hypothetical protein